MLSNHGVGDHGLLRVPWTARRWNLSVLKEISPEYSLEGLMLKLKCEYFGQLMWRVNSSEKTLMLGKIEGKRRSGWQRTRWKDGITNSMDMNLTKFREMVKDSRAWRAAIHGVAKIWRWLSDWTTALQLTLLQFSGFSCIFRTVCLSPQLPLEYCLQPRSNLAPRATTLQLLAGPDLGNH